VTAVIVLPLYTTFFIYPSFIELLTENLEERAIFIARHIAADSFNGKTALSKSSVPPNFDDYIRAKSKELNFMKVKVFAPDGEIIYSTDPKDIGQINREKYFLEAVARGGPYKKIVKKDTKSLEGQTVSMDVIEAYVPIMRDNRFIGAFEIYLDITKDNARLNKVIRHTLIAVFGITALLLAAVIASLYKAFQTIKEQERVDERLKQQQQQLEILNKTLEKRVQEEVMKSREKDRLMIQQSHLADLGKMAASITHEINTPMTYIKGNLELLKMSVDESDVKVKHEINKFIDPVFEGIKRISNIIESMKEISGFSKKDKIPSNVFSTIVLASRMIYNRAKHLSDVYINGHKLDLHTDKDKEVFTAAIAAQSMEQVWIIILNNALDEFEGSDMPFEDRYIKIEISKMQDKIRVLVKDNAGEIPGSILNNLFDLFSSTKPKTGMGIGLNVAKTIIEDHSGSIRAYNDNSEAIFEVVL